MSPKSPPDCMIGWPTCRRMFVVPSRIRSPNCAATRGSWSCSGPASRATSTPCLHALRYDIAVERVEAPTAALEYARRLAQHGVPVNALVRAYRLGQRRMNELVFAELRAIEIPERDAGGGDRGDDRRDVRLHRLDVAASRRRLRRRTRTMAGEPEQSSRPAGARGPGREQDHRCRCGNHLDPLSAAVAPPGAGHVVSRTSAPKATNFPGCKGFSANWAKPPAPPPARSSLPPTEVVAGGGCRIEPRWPMPLRRFAGSRKPDRIRRAWQSGRWLAASRAFAAHTGEAGKPAASRSSAAAGYGADGDRRQDPGLSVVARLGGDVAGTREWVATVLGDLAGDNENDARLRETLRVYPGLRLPATRWPPRNSTCTSTR